MTAGHASVLVVDDEPYIREVCGRALERAGHTVALAEDGESALREIERSPLTAAVLDINLPDTDGLQLLREVKGRNPDAVVVLITGFATLETAMEAVRLGAYEYVRKPFGAADLVRIVGRGLESQRLKGRNDELLRELQSANDELIAGQEQIRERMQVATADLTAFVELGRRLGETSDLQETLRSIIQAGLQVTRARAAAVYQAQDAPDALRGLMTLGMAERDVAGVQVPEDSLLARVAATALECVENDLLAPAIAEDEHLSFLGVQSVLASPLIWDGRVRGVLALFDQHDGGFSQQSLDLVRVLSAQAARVVAAMGEAAPDGVLHGPDEDGFVDLAKLL
jgi:DNA-binding response OmpR family regulator